jgi:hypothetical protein
VSLLRTEWRLTQAEERQDRQDHDDQTNQINQAMHGSLQ